MKVDRMKQRVEFRGEDGCSLEICYSNMGEPFREGIQLSLDEGDHERSPYIFLEQHEAKELRDLLNRLYPE
jgi:hypothetical protein